MKRFILWLTICLLFSSPHSYSQTTSPAVKGRVVDAATGIAVEFANVVIVDADNHTIASATVSKGEFSISETIDGDYFLTIQLIGYQPYTSDPITFRANSPIDQGGYRHR